MFRNLINVPFADRSPTISVKIVAMIPDSLVDRSTLYILRITLLIYTTISDRTVLNTSRIKQKRNRANQISFLDRQQSKGLSVGSRD